MNPTKIFSRGLTFAAVFGLCACGGVQRNPGRAYMADMTFARSYQTYATTEDLTAEGVHYDHQPVPGTIARGELLPFLLTKDPMGDSTNYVKAREIKDPLPPLDSLDMLEAQRLFNVNCAICHGPKLDGNGPLYNGGNGPFPAKPAQLVGGPQYMVMPVGQMFYSVTYGKNLMGSYASQLDRRQRWMVIQYIKSQQAASLAKTDSSATAKK